MNWRRGGRLASPDAGRTLATPFAGRWRRHRCRRRQRGCRNRLRFRRTCGGLRCLFLGFAPGGRRLRLRRQLARSRRSNCCRTRKPRPTAKRNGMRRPRDRWSAPHCGKGSGRQFSWAQPVQDRKIRAGDFSVSGKPIRRARAGAGARATGCRGPGRRRSRLVWSSRVRGHWAR